ncbi:TIGR03619 family F420-dependent LLM class oxidoreductase [Streptomyces litchfieldiae]|uniref:TIGR03619 family F420-dependent LLM class oxidoreductase n=1 Tax=Streptomyces litchfieldiae TaxID=3075543 RepID=A0ABU2MLU5_9ACTN|nr:TIGR03619 family F420-dependent LLM class oxidoreductase [Streptomyces sp. DSM 44938]MDT0342465.1 TIGR03619 family F420-dependent LLM class oxidoreductase [Streptomyces sp. DSM 44938]
MELHVVLPDADPHSLAVLAREAENLGYGGVWLPDHLLPPAPYGPVYGGVDDALVTLAHLAGATTRLVLGTSVLVLPLRNPFVVAKQSATLARLSGGRFVLGVGAGWERHEFDATGGDFATRGARTTSALRLIRHLHTTGGAPFDDPYYGFGGGVFAPVPGRPVPLLVGGVTDAALRRAAAVADWWQAVGLTPERFAERAARLKSLTERPIGLANRTVWADGQPVGDAAAEIAANEEAGADQVAVSLISAFRDTRTAVERMRELSAEPAVARYLATGDLR